MDGELTNAAVFSARDAAAELHSHHLSSTQPHLWDRWASGAQALRSAALPTHRKRRWAQLLLDC